MSDIHVNGMCPACRDESLALIGSSGAVKCNKRKADHISASTCPDPDQITRILDAARWIDEANGGEQDVYRTKVDVPHEWTVGQLDEFIDMLNALDDVRCYFDMKAKHIVIQVHPPHSLSHSYIPAGTHEFARGWGMRHAMGLVAEKLERQIEWREHRVHVHQPWRELRSEKRTVTV